MDICIALFGAGYWGKNHLRDLKRLGALNTVVDANDRVIEERKKEHPDVIYTKDERRVLENPEIRACVVASPASLHFSLAKKLLLAGKDVLVEKPLALLVDEGRELVDIAERENRVLMVGHILQYHPAVERLKQIVMEGELGTIRYLYSNRLNLGKLRVEENVLWSFAPHDISLILMLMQEKRVQGVHAFGGSYVTDGIYDTTLTGITFVEDVKGHIYVSWLHPFKEQKLVVIGSEKMAVFDDLSPEKLYLYPYRVNLENGNTPVAERAEHHPVSFEMREPLKAELSHFIQCVRERKTLRTDGYEGLRVLEVIEMAERSLEKKAV